jgi:hypothetical protein
MERCHGCQLHRGFYALCIFGSDVWMTQPGKRHFREILFGGASPSIHPPILYHSGMAWMLAFQFLQTMVDSCHDEVVPPGIAKGSFGIDELDPRLMPTYVEEDTLSDVTRKWRNRSDTFVNRCSDPNFHPGNTCSLSWIVHRSSAISIVSTTCTGISYRSLGGSDTTWLECTRVILSGHRGLVGSRQWPMRRSVSMW